MLSYLISFRYLLVNLVFALRKLDSNLAHTQLVLN
jgi:hypothetical protein